jgi:hypothetical protein
MKTIYKYKLTTTDNQVLSLPAFSEILTVQLQGGEPYLWALVNKNIEEEIPITIEIFGTGNPIPDGKRRYINTYQLLDGRLVFHVFERLD